MYKLALINRATATAIWLAVSGWAWTQSLGPYKDVAKMPEGQVGQRVEALLSALDSGNRQTVETFLKTHLTDAFLGMAPLEDHISVMLGVYRRHRGLAFHSVREYENPPKTDPGEIQVTVIAKSRLLESWRGLLIELEDKPPHKINGLRFAPARRPSNLGEAPKLTEAEMVADLRSFLKRLEREDAFSGTALIVRHGKELFRGAYGLASRRFDVANRIDTKFNLGSMNKMFTAIAIAQLVEKGKLKYEDPISKYIGEDWLAREAAEKIQVRHLLTHTSGLGSYFTDEFMNNARPRYRVIEDYKPLVANDRPAFEPGTNWRYSNTGFLLLGVVIQSVSGQTYYDYIRDHIYRPAGMTDSDCYEMDEPTPNLAIGYTREHGHGQDEKWRTNNFLHSIKGGPAGGGYSTVIDLRRFADAFLSGKLVSMESVRRLTSAKPELNSPGYGYGFGVSGGPGARIVGHTGGFPGINSALDMYLDAGFTVAVMANNDDGASVVQQRLREMIGRLEPLAAN